MNMNNLMLLQRQHLKPIKIVLVIADCMWALFLLFLLLELGGEFVLEFGGLLIILIILNLILLEARKPSASLKRLPPDVLSYVNAHCLTGLRFGNGILCDNDCLVLIGNIMVTAVMLRDVTRLELRPGGKGVILLEGKENPGSWNNDPNIPLAMKALAMNNNSNRGMINGAERRVKGARTFREADRDVFWRALCDAWKKYTDTEPIVS